MTAKLIVLCAAFAYANAVPVLLGNSYIPGWFFRTGRAPSIAFGFGSGFSSDIGGIRQSSGIGSSFSTGDATAYGAGFGSTNGNTFAQGIGYAQAAPIQQFGFNQANPAAFNNAFGRNYGSAFSSAQNFGNFGAAISSAQSQNGFGSAVSAVQSNGLGRYQTAVSSAQNLRGLGYESAISSASNNGLGYGSAVSAAQNFGGYGSAVSSIQNQGDNNFGSAVSAAQNFGGYGTSTAQSTQLRGASIQQSGASSISGPGVQASQSHAINNGYY